MHRDGSHQKALVKGVDPAIAPDGHRIAFSRAGGKFA